MALPKNGAREIGVLKVGLYQIGISQIGSLQAKAVHRPFLGRAFLQLHFDGRDLLVCFGIVPKTPVASRIRILITGNAIRGDVSTLCHMAS